MSASIDRFELRAAAHLSNTGIALLKGKSFRQAIKTLGDALLVIKAATARSLGTHGSSNEYCAEVEQKIQAAAQRLAKPERVALKAASRYSFEVLSDDEIPSAFQHESKAHSNVLHLIRMESSVSEASMDSGLSIAAAIVFYNYGVACRALGSPAHMKKSLHMFRFALSTIASCESTAANCFGSHFRRQSLIMLFTLGHLVQLSHMEGMHGKLKEYSARLGNLRYNLSKISAMDSKLPAKAARAA